MTLTELRVDRLKREMGKLELLTTGAKNELLRWLRGQLKQQCIDMESYEFEDEEERELQVPATPIGVDINSLLAAMMEKMQILMDVQKASRTENQKLLAGVQDFWLNRDEIMNKEWKECKQRFCQKFKRRSK